jgi:FkbM family methyltransferase
MTIYNKAVYTCEDTFKFYFDDPLSQGGSLISNHNSNYYDSKSIDKVEVQSVDIVKLIDSLHDDGYTIVVKLDVESSEYDILEKLIETKSIFKISKMYCEFHSQYMNEQDKKQYVLRENFISEFMQKNNINFEVWI